VWGKCLKLILIILFKYKIYILYLNKIKISKTMAKVFLSFNSSAKADFSQEAVNKLNSNNIPYEVSENTIYLINKEAFSTICIESGKKNYEPHETFCMGIADSSESTIEMDITEGATLEALEVVDGVQDKSLFPVLYEIFRHGLEFEMTLDCNSLSETVIASILYDEEKEEYYFKSEIREDYYDEDYDEEW
tara:strand:- start:38 stop:610 length:573 start_codon:yes stop_codon:yes gene_type:complete